MNLEICFISGPGLLSIPETIRAVLISIRVRTRLGDLQLEITIGSITNLMTVEPTVKLSCEEIDELAFRAVIE